ncbi:MAG: potassium transporter TrkG [Desulfovibrionaceae bacterium]
MVIFIMGVLIICLGLTMVFPLLVSLYYQDGATMALGLSLLTVVGVGAVLTWGARHREKTLLSHREGLAIVGLCWIAASLAGGLPYILGGHISFTDAVFESASGFTTTGASILSDVESMPKGILLWRSLTHWLGGMGIILLSLAILPLFGMGGMQLYKAEVPGPSPDKLTPRLQDTAMLLWKVYGLLTIVQIILLILAGMDTFDAVNHTFATVATGGFSTKNTSIAAFPSPVIQWILIVFMFLAGINFALHYKWLRGDFKVYRLDRECVLYTVLIFLGGALITLGLVWRGVMPFDTLSNIEATVRAAYFQAVSICTTTGFVSENFALWPAATLCVLLFLMFLGGCAGSTSGGMKVMRIRVLYELINQEIFRLVHPHSVRHLKMGGQTLAPTVVTGVVGFILLYLCILFASTFILTIFELDLVTAFTATLTCLSNVGPGLGSVGPVENFGHLPNPVKWVLTLCMLIGRLEIYAIFILFVPEFWKH